MGEEAEKVDTTSSGGEEKDYDSVMDEIKRRKEERRKQQEEDERREEAERKKREEERQRRKEEREKKAKEREESFQKELEEKKIREQKEEERKKRKEERERQKEEEDRKEREEEERRKKEREDRRRALEEQEQEEQKKREEKREEATQAREASYTPPVTLSGLLTGRRDEEPPAVQRYVPGSSKRMIDQILEIVNDHPNAGHKATIDKLVDNEDMRDEVQRHLNEEHTALTEYFSKPEVVTVVISCLSVIPNNPQSMRTAQVDGIVARMEFARDLISGTAPQLWKKLLHVDNYPVLDELFTLLKSDAPVLPLFHVNCFWKSLEFLIYRRGFEVSSYLLSRKTDVITSFFKHLRDSNVMDILIKLVDNEAVTPAYKEYNPRGEEILSWCDDLPSSIIAALQEEDTEQSDEKVDGLSNFVNLVFEKHPSCKLAYQLREYTFASAIVKHAFSGPTKYESTLLSLVNFITLLLKPSVNTSSYTIDLLPPLVSSMVAATPSGGTPIDILADWLRNGSLLQKTEKPSNKRTFLAKSGSSSPFSVFRMKCLLCVQVLASLNYKCVDEALQSSGALAISVDSFFLHQDNNIIHCSVEELLKHLLVRELHNPENGGKLTEHILSSCNLVERIVEGLSTKKAISSMKGKFDTRIESPPFSGHVLNICKLLCHVAEKSFATRTLIAECSGYRWGQVVLFRLGMRASSDNEWKAPMKKVDTTDVGVTSAGGPVID